MTAATAAGATRARIGPAVVPLLALAVFINYIDRGNLATATPLIKDELGLSAAQIGVLASAFSWTYVPTQLLAGWLAERINPYRTLAIGVAIWSASTFLTGFAGGFTAILILRLLLGVGESAFFPCSSKLIGQHVEGHKLGGVNGLMAQGMSLGPAFGVFFGGLLMAGLGWRNVFLVFGAVSLLWLLPWMATTRRLSLEADQPQAEPAPSVLAILGRRELWGASVGHFASAYGFYFVISWLPLYLVKARGYSVAEMATASGLVYLAYAAAAFLSGWLTDRWMKRGWTPNRARKLMAVASHVGGAAGLLLCALDPDLAMVGLFVAGAAMGLVNPQLYAIGQTLAGRRAAGKWISVQNCLGNLAGIVGPIVTGLIIDRTGGFGVAFVVAAALTLVGVVGWLAMVPRVEPVDWSRV